MAGTWFRRRRTEQPAGPSNLGDVVDAKVSAAAERRRPVGEDADYDLVREHLDVAHYFLQAPRMVDQPHVDVVRNFLRQGPRVRMTPDINFSVQAYLARHPERGQDPDASPYVGWLREGRAAGEIGDPGVGLEKVARILGAEPATVAEHLGESRRDLQERLRHGRLGEMFAKAAAIDPLVADAWSETTRPKMTPLPAPVVVDQMHAVFACHEAAGFRTARAVVVAQASDDALTTLVVAALTERLAADEVVVLVTGAMGEAGPAGPRVVDFAAAREGLHDSQAEQVLAELVRTFDADVVVGTGSQLFLDTLTPFGKALRASERIFLALPGLAAGPLGQLSGPALRYFYRHLDVVTGFVAADKALLDVLAETYQLPDDVRSRVHLADGDLGALLLGGESR